jgi:biopolymer transport protein ExbD
MKKFEFKFKQPNFIPLLDVFFVILIFFLFIMVILSPESKLDISLPHLHNNSSLNMIKKNSALHLALYPDGNIKIAQKSYTLFELKEFLQNIPRKKSLIIEADKNIRFSQLMFVLEVLYSVGIKKVSFAYLIQK